MKDKRAFLKSFILIAAIYSCAVKALIIEGQFVGNVVYANDCTKDTQTPVADCTLLWNESPIGTVATGSFWYDTDLAPADSSPAEHLGLYFTYSNSWLHATLNIGGKTFDISNSAVPSEAPPGDVEYVSIFDSFDIAPDGTEKQAILMADKTASTKPNGDYTTKSLNIALETWQQRIVDGVSLVQENEWIENGNLLQGSSSFNFTSFNDQQLQVASAWISYTDFSMGIKNNASVPEPASLMLFILGMVTLVVRRGTSHIN